MDAEAFVEAVKEHRELYDKKCKFYMDTKCKDKIWKDLSENFGIDAKKKWTAIRDRYVREKNKNALPSGSAAKPTHYWYLYPLLGFLDDCIKPREMRENTEAEVNILETSCSAEESNSFEPSNTPSTSSIPRKRRAKDSDEEVNKLFLDTLTQFADKLKSASADDEDGYFLKSIKCKMMKMTEEEKSNFKIEMLMQADDAVRSSFNKSGKNSND